MDWAAPDAAAEAHDAPPDPPGPPAHPAAPAAAEPRPLAPMTMSDLLDGGFAILKRPGHDHRARRALFVPLPG